MRQGRCFVALLVVGIGSSLCFGASATYFLQMDGGQVPGGGDADGTATGTITLDDVTGLVSWDITYADIAPPTAMHIHGPNGSAGQSAGVHIGLNVAGGAGTLIGSVVNGDLQEITDIFADPTDFYWNIHNGDFGGGAIRYQLGTPSSATYLLQMDGDQVPGGGDVDGTATGTITLDVPTNEVSWNIAYENIQMPTAMHIHGPNGGPGQSAGVHIGLNTAGGVGTLIGSVNPASVQDVVDVLVDPTDFYLNIHTSDFGGGAIRDQLGSTGSVSGAVPDGDSVPGNPLELDKAGGGSLDLDWDASCLSTDTDYEIYEGDIGSFYSHEMVLCTTGGSTSANIAPGPDSHYYLVVPTDGAVEGSYGTNSSSTQRPPGAPDCLPQSLANPVCP